MTKIMGLTGDGAIAYAAKQSKVDVVAAYPITPQTIIVESFSEYVHNGEVETEFVCVESEHSAMSASIGSSLAGARVFTATASQGLALMHEMLYVASGLRCPIVMGVANRALSAPINIHADHSDMMGSRDCSWIQIYAENAQEAYDWTIQAFKIAENNEILLPITVNIDGFIISHSTERVEVLDDTTVAEFQSTRKSVLAIDPDKPFTVGALALTDYYLEMKYQQVDAFNKMPKILGSITREYDKLSNRSYKQIDTYGLDDAESCIICLGSTAGTAKHVARRLREKGEKVGVIKPWLYRPFPEKEIVNAVKNVKTIAVLDRACSFGAPYGPLCSDIISTLYKYKKNLNIFNVIYGLGGRDITPSDIMEIFNETTEISKTGIVKTPFKFIGVRE